MEQEKEEFLKTIDAINHDDRIVQAWMLENKYRLMEIDQLGTAERKGFKDAINNVIKNMLSKDMDYETIAMATNKSVSDIMKIAHNLDS